MRTLAPAFSPALSGTEWQAARPVVCRSLGLTPQPAPTLALLSEELDATYRVVAARLPENKHVRFETIAGKQELVLSPLDKLEEPPSLVALRKEIKSRMPRVDLPEILLEIAARTDCMSAFTHLTERSARAVDLTTSLCAVLLAEACNTGPGSHHAALGRRAAPDRVAQARTRPRHGRHAHLASR